MNILINCSNLKNGGGLQVADSFCKQLYKYEQHHFYIVLSSALTYLKGMLEMHKNTTIIIYDLKKSIWTVLGGRNKILDNLVIQNNINVALTVFGPSIWIPRCPHLCGFARAQLILKDSPYYKRIGIKTKVIYKIWAWAFKRCSHVFFSENDFISDQLQKLFRNVKTYTVTNYYNQIFDEPSEWKRDIEIKKGDGIIILTLATPYPHKNIGITIDITKYLKKNYPNFKFHFVLTCKESDIEVPSSLLSHFTFIDRVNITQCPYLYEQSDILFMPSLMECFTASYPEAMKMGVPIVTTDLNFAKSLCGNAACYYSSIDPASAAEAIYKVASDKEYASKLIANGKERLKKFDNYNQRADKLIEILEKISNKCLI